MTTLWLVRHGQPRIDPQAPPHVWPLGPDTDEITALRDHLPSGAAWYSSPEPKALGTARVLTDQAVTVVDDLREAVRPAVWFDDAAQFEALVRRSVLLPHVPVAAGWEPAATTRVRVEAATRELIAAHTDGDVVAVGHGTAWLLLVSVLTHQPPDLDAWAAMTMPDLALLDAPENGPARLRRHWGQL
ncbi:MAG: histidine phosphatase family protein [Nocardioidaceae bacterium]|nr:histidine phosphatase family protein [Nocardioidaceae bacterium]